MVYKASKRSMASVNEIRNYIEKVISKISGERNMDLNLINMSIGDPTIYDFKAKPEIISLLAEKSSFANYNPSKNEISIAKSSLKTKIDKYSKRPVSTNNIILGAGCSLSLYFSVMAVIGSEENIILMPRPSFPLIIAFCQTNGRMPLFYDLDANKNWEIDIEGLKATLKEYGSKIKAIVINSPANPCGNVFSKAHIQDISQLLENYDITIISDDTYEEMTFKGIEYYPIISENTKNPIFYCSGLSKSYFAPGWRFGWACYIPSDQSSKEDQNKFQKKLSNMQECFGLPNTVNLVCLSECFLGYEDFFKNNITRVEERYQTFLNELSDIKGIKVIPSQGSFYLTISTETSSKELAIKLYKEKSIQVLPGELFYGKNFIRLVMCSDVDVIVELGRRMKEL